VLQAPIRQVGIEFSIEIENIGILDSKGVCLHMRSSPKINSGENHETTKRFL